MTFFRKLIASVLALSLGACAGDVTGIANVGVANAYMGLSITISEPQAYGYPAYYSCYQGLYPGAAPGCGSPGPANNWWKY